MTDCSWHDEDGARRLRGAGDARGGAGGRLALYGALAVLALWIGLQAAHALGGGGRFGEAWIDETYDEAVRALDEGAGIALREPVEVVLLTAEEALARRQAFARRLDEHAGITAGADFLADMFFSETMLGRYLPDERVIYVIEDVLEEQARGDPARGREVLFGVVSHELVHAYDDQVYDCMPTPADALDLVADPEAMLELQTTMALFEGRATYAAELAAAAAGREPLELPTLEEAKSARVFDGGDDPLASMAAGFGNSVARMKILQYVHGREFAKAAHDFGGEPFFEHVFASLPISMAELKDFGRFKIRWAEELEERLDAEDADPPYPGTP